MYHVVDALKEYIGLRLVGPYLILAGQLSKVFMGKTVYCSHDIFMIHQRFKLFLRVPLKVGII